MTDPAGAPAVLRCRDVDVARLERLLEGLGLDVMRVADGAPIPGTYWGEPEAGLRGSTL